MATYYITPRLCKTLPPDSYTIIEDRQTKVQWGFSVILLTIQTDVTPLTELQAVTIQGLAHKILTQEIFFSPLKNDTDKRYISTRTIQVILCGLCGISNYNFFESNNPDRAMPHPRSFIAIKWHMSPPGDSIALRKKEDIIWQPSREDMYIPGPTFGYGNIVYDDEKKFVGQIVDTTFYIFVSPKACDHTSVAERDKACLKAVTIMWNFFVNEKTDDWVCASEEEYASMHQQLKDVKQFHATIDLQTINIELERIKEAWQQLLAQKAGLCATHSKRPSLDVADQWRRLNEHPRAVRIVASGQMIMVDTDLICIEHEGVTYKIGRFAVAFISHDTYDNVMVWPIETCHPKDLPHPHMEGITPCFGNLTERIITLASHRRHGECFDLVVRWLVEGYEPKLTVYTIEEWPLYVEACHEQSTDTEKAHELLTSNQDLQSRSCTTRYDLRRRLNRQRRHPRTDKDGCHRHHRTRWRYR